MEIVEAIKKTFQKLTIRSILISVILIAVAVLLITNPEKVLTVAVIISGIALIVNAIIHIVVYMGQDPEIRAMSSEFLIGIIECVAGIAFIINQEKVISIFYVIIGVWLVIESIQKLQMALNLREYISNWALTIIVAILDLALGILVITHPYDAGTSVTQVTGIILAVSEGCNLIESIYTFIRVKKMGVKIEKVMEKEAEKSEK